MTPQEAQSFGREKTLRATSLIAIILIFIAMLVGTSGDFANGILFFIQAITNIHFLAMLTIVFVSTFVFGSWAGKEIIIDNKNNIWISVKYSVSIILLAISYATIIGISQDKTVTEDNSVRLLTTYFLTPLVKTGSLAITPMLVIWLWATNQMQLMRNKDLG
jgi:hypothetical protein